MHKIVKILCLFIFSLLTINVSANSVVDIFDDIDSNYAYLEELQSLYDAGIILPDANNNFNPNSLLTRGDFTSMIMSLKCEECLQPNTSASIIYEFIDSKPFYDLGIGNQNYYCIALATLQSVVRGYGVGYECNNNLDNFIEDERPFCPIDNITLEEALAVIIRNSGVDIEQNPSTDNDLLDKYDDVDSNSDFYKYIVAGFSDNFLMTSDEFYDSEGNPKEINLLEHIDSNNLGVSQNISREKFLQMAYFFYIFTGSCNFSESIESGFGLSIDICEPGDELCIKKDLDSYESTYKFSPNISQTCSEGTDSYLWKIYNPETLDFFTYDTPNIDSHEFTNGDWKIRLIVKDNCNQLSESSLSFSYNDGGLEGGSDDGGLEGGSDDGNNKIVNIDGPINGISPFEAYFESITSGFGENAKYTWNFGDGNSSNEQNPTHIFTKEGTYYVELTVVEDGIEKKANIVIKIETFIDDFDRLYGLDNEELINELDKLKNNTNDNILKDLIDDIINNLEENDDYNPIDDLDKLKDLILYDDGYEIDRDKDTDGDGVPDYRDKCIGVPGVEENDGCPILDNKCNILQHEMMECPRGYKCNNDTDTCEPESIKNHNLAGTYLFPDSLSGIFGNIKCRACPCYYTLSFIADIRKCDIVFPTITGSGGIIESRGEFFQILAE